MVNLNSIEIKLKQWGFNNCTIDQTTGRIEELQNLGVSGIDRLVRKLKSATNQGDFRDYWLEGTYSRVFANNNLPVDLEPCGKKGPDMLIKVNGYNIYLEVRHFRQVPYPTNRKARFVSSAIKDKLTQILDNEINIVVIRNGRLDMSIWSFYKGIYLRKALCRGNADWANKWSNLSGIIMDMSLVDSRSHKPFYWRFLRTSKEKVPRHVKRRMKEILERQTEIEHQKIKNMFPDYFLPSLFC